MNQLHIALPNGASEILDEASVVEALQSGRMNGRTMFWTTGMTEWQPLATKFPQHCRSTPPPIPSPQVPEGAITSSERSQMWKKFWLCAVGALVANIFMFIVVSGLGGLPPLVALSLPAIPPALIWAWLAKQLEKYKAHTGISYPTTYVVLGILSVIGLLGPLLMLISFSIRLGRIPVIQPRI